MGLSKTKDAKEFIKEWEAHPNKNRAKKQLMQTAREQRANLNAVKTAVNGRLKGKNPSWCTVEEYTESVELLEAAAVKMAKS